MKKTLLGILIAVVLCLFVDRGLGRVYAQSTGEETGQEMQQGTPVPSDEGTESGQGMQQGGESQPGQDADQGAGSSQGESAPPDNN